MKKVFLVIGIFLFSIFLYGQEVNNTRNSVRFGINRAFFGSGDIVGPGIYAEYSYSLNNYFAMSPRIMSAYANRNDEGNFAHASSFVTSLSIRITPLPNFFKGLKIDFGGLYHRFINSHGSIEEKDEYNDYHSNDAIYYKEDLFGLLGSLNINVFENKRLETGLRFDILTSFTEGSFNCDSWQIGTYIGLKF